ncbi:hypothetical protein Palpr_1568 [Paludibacter propionicigenes WB4]|uniref:Uncharacterized protein n=1 Tax=Paludibacter propionicigenes (strain DSM 17365 / JCM 13257 / WB4) TaxID=694427 RepID=E4T4R9_PALPW|nr:hypothetical protein Palpr_1568 [Paludibacter propionicigenes WB4]
MVYNTKLLVGGDTYKISRFMCMKSKIALKMKEPVVQVIDDELGKLFKQTTASTKKAVIK